MQVIFFKSTQDYKHPNRTLTPIHTADIRLQEDTAVLDPVILVEYFAEWRDVNCIWIELFNRYYFLSESPCMKGGRIEYILHVDVLKTYGDSLMAQTALIDRQEYIFSPWIDDPLLKTRSNRIRDIVKIGSLGSPSAGSNYALTVVGGQ